MATGRRYFWIKLSKEFLQSDEVDYLMQLEHGGDYVLLYEAICLQSANTCGKLCKTVGTITIRYDAQKLAREFKWFSVDFIESALNIYQELGLLNLDRDGILFVPNIGSMAGSETDYAKQKRAQRNEAPAPPGCGHCPPDVHTDVHSDVHKIVHTDKELDKESDSDIEEDKDLSTSILQGEKIIKGGVGENGDAQPQDSCESDAIPEKKDGCGQCPPTVHTDVHSNVQTDFVDDFSARPRSQREIETDFNELRNQAIKKLVESGYR